MIYNPPADVCSYINCIDSFCESTNGYVIQCSNGELLLVAIRVILGRPSRDPRCGVVERFARVSAAL